MRIAKSGLVSGSWTKLEDEMLTEKWQDLTRGELARLLSRTVESVQHRIHKIGLKRTGMAGRTKSVASELVDVAITAKWGTMCTKQLAHEVGLTDSAVYNRAHRLGLVKKKVKADALPVSHRA